MGMCVVDEQLVALMARPAEMTPWGKCDTRAVTLLPEDVHGELLQAANRYGMSVSDFLRKCVLVALYGRDEVQHRYTSMLEGMPEICTRKEVSKEVSDEDRRTA